MVSQASCVLIVFFCVDQQLFVSKVSFGVFFFFLGLSEIEKSFLTSVNFPKISWETHLHLLGEEI